MRRVDRVVLHLGDLAADGRGERRQGAGMYAPRSSSRVHTVMSWLQQAIMERRRQGGLLVPAPLLTRMYQLLSDGMLGYEQCRCAPNPHHLPLPACGLVAVHE